MRWATACAWILAGYAACAACVSSPPGIVDAPPELDRSLEVHTGTFEYRVGPGDVLRINVFNHPELSSPQLPDSGTSVDANGRVMLPLIGAVDVNEKTVFEVAEAVTAGLRKYLKEPHVDAQVVRFGAHRYVVVGEVRQPGVYFLDRPTTALEALARSGGPATFANREQVAWVRGGFRHENLVLFDASGLDPRAMQLIEPGDVLFVARRGWADSSEAARDILPILQSIAIPAGIALQAATLEQIL